MGEAGMEEAPLQAVKTRDPKLINQAATIWAEATAYRDEISAGEVDIAEAVPLMEKVLGASERAFLLAVSDQNDEIVCFAAIEPEREQTSPDRGELRYIGVAPEHWGEGWARRLLLAVPDAAREEKFEDIILWVYADNTRAIWVYEAMGWNATGRTRPNEQTGRIEAEYKLKLIR